MECAGAVARFSNLGAINWPLTAPSCRCLRLITSWVRHGPLIAAASGPPIIQAVLWAGILLAS